jgi:hypothetical protein
MCPCVGLHASDDHQTTAASLERPVQVLGLLQFFLATAPSCLTTKDPACLAVDL